MNLHGYLERINYRRDLSPTLKTLTELQKAHLVSIPFENLDIHSKTKIKLDPAHLFNKIVENKRGGFCYELNGLFYSLLIELGFDVKMVSARVFSKDRGYGPERDHMALIVTIDGENYLSDVGFGDFINAPLKIELDTIQKDETGMYSIDRIEDSYRVNKVEEEQSKANYIFTLDERKLNDFDAMCHFQQYDPSSNFIKKKKITKATDTGRIYLDEEVLSIEINGNVSKTKIENEDEFQKALTLYFGSSF